MIAALLLAAASVASQHYSRASALFDRQKFSEANEALDQALAADPNYVPALTLKGKLAMGFNRFDVARVAFSRAAEIAPDSAYAQFMLGFFYYVDNDFIKAAPALERALKLNPSDARASLYLAMSQDGLARPDLAVPLYERTIELERRAGQPSAETHTAYGRLLFTLGRYEEAAKQVARVLELDPNSRDGHYEMGRLSFEQGRWAEAAAHGEKALAAQGLGTTERQIHFLLARAYGKLGRKDLAEQHRQKFETSPATLRR
ncbi:MAG: tetratricopeptide repeat protein [Acidobacteria bacterium]|nr:tetratricopeptide repeat protein [Acidobacteriota bacterium]MBI3278817.1 tetratricopeptide repeat protein [Acidobacteriota bacterium]